MAEGCPDAWLLNYTNPMAMNIGYLTAAHPDLKVLGLCHSVHWTVVDLCELVGAPFDEVSFRSAGVNHQAWLLDWRHGDRGPLPAPGRPDRGGPGAAAPGARGHVPAARLLPHRDQRALLRVRRVVPPRRRRDRAAAHPAARLRRHQRRQRRGDRAARRGGRRRRVRRAGGGRRRVRTRGDPQPGHRDPPRDPGEPAQHRPHRQPACRRAGRGAGGARRQRGAAGRGGCAATAVRRRSTRRSSASSS